MIKKRFFLLLSIYLFVSCYSNVWTQTNATFTQVGPVKFPNNPSVQTTGMGRVSQLVFHPIDSNIIFAVTASGGIFKTSNEGLTWMPLSDFLPQTSCASLLINPTNPNVMYLGTGDANYDANGLGVYKSSNGGKTWAASNTGMGNILVSKMLFTPGDTSTLIAACRDGIYKSINSGASWVKKTTLAASYRDLHYRPQSTSIVYAATNANFYRSYNNGETWTQSTINSGITSAGIKIAVCPSDTSKIYCLVWKSGATSPFGGIYTSNNNGSSFSLQNDTPNILGYSNNGTSMDGQGAYNLALIVDQNDANTIYVGAINLWKSSNGGFSFNLLSHWAFGVHADKHNYYFSPFNSKKLYICHDGGLDRSLNDGGTWTTLEDGLSASEFYKIGASGLYNDYIIGGLQDNGKDISVNKNFSTVGGGDWGGDFEFDRFDSSLLYENGGVKRNIVSNTTGSINGHGGIYLPHPNDSNVMFEIDTNVRRTTNLRTLPSTGVSWTTLSAIAGTVPSGTKCHAYSKMSNGTYYVFFSPQLFYKSNNINAPVPVFTQITTFPFNASEVIKQIETVDYDSNSLYVLTNQTRIFKSPNKGISWYLLNRNLPASSFIKFELDQKSFDSSMYICTAFNVYYRNSTMSNWISFSQGLPSIAKINDMEIMSDGTNKGRLFIGTYGRGIWQSNLYASALLAPLADFTMQANSSQPCPNTFILSNNTTNSPLSQKWSLIPATGWQYINGSDSLSIRPEIRFNTPGIYNVSLTATNAAGTSTKTINFTFAPIIPAASCVTTTTNPTGYGMGIQRFELNTINNPSSIGSASNTDFTCLQSTVLKAGTSYTAWVTTGTTNSENQKIYIDYNGNGIFTDANELVASLAAATGRRSVSFSILSNPPLVNQFLRLRVVTNFSSSAAPSCGVLSYGESEDYAIFIDTIRPALAITLPKPNVLGIFNVTYTLSENVSGFTNSDISVSNGTSSNFYQVNGNTFTSSITPLALGKIIVTVNANSFSDLAGNTNLAAKDSTLFGPLAIETAMSSSSLNLGPNQTDTFYSPNGNIMAVIVNLSSFNYGLTTLSIDNSGTGASNYGNNTTANKRIANKTYQVIPTNSNPTGLFTIRLFYTLAEVNGWKSVTGSTFAAANILKCPNTISSGTLANGVYGNTRSQVNFAGSGDSVISATFSSGFGGFAMGTDIIVLPVSLLNFDAKKSGEKVQLNWTTASETNSSFFYIERSSNRIDFEKLGSVKAAGNSNTRRNYFFEDLTFHELNEPDIFYRLKMLDRNGDFKYSDIRTIDNRKEITQIQIMPQPAKDVLLVKTPPGFEYRYLITDSEGKLMQKGSSSIQETELIISSLKTGIYFLQISHPDMENQVFKFLKVD